MNPHWATATRRFIATVVLGGTAVAGLSAGVPNASAAAGGDTLMPGETLRNEQFIRSSNGYSLVMQGDGNAVIYKPLTGGGRTPIWASNTPGRSNSWLIMQADGNLVLYSGSTPYWASGMKGSGSYLTMQTDGNLVMYRPNGSGGRSPVWASNTAQSAGGAVGLPPSPPTTKMPPSPTPASTCANREVAAANRAPAGNTLYWIRFSYRYCFNGRQITGYSVLPGSFRITNQALTAISSRSLKNMRFTVAPYHYSWNGDPHGALRFRVNADVEQCDLNPLTGGMTTLCTAFDHQFDVRPNAKGSEWWQHSGD